MRQHRPGRASRATSILEAAWWAAASLAEPGLRLLLRRRLARGKEEAGRIAERRGRPTLARPPGRLLWLHAASVGETVSVLSLLGALLAEDPALHVLMTTGSATSQRLLASRLDALGLGGRVHPQFAPWDVPRWLTRFLAHWQPQALVLVESELWPNLLSLAGGRGIPMALVNARLSARSFDRWRRLPGAARRLLGRFRWITARSEEDAQRLRALGASVVDSPGDLKAAAPDLPADEAELARLRALLGRRPVLLAASTHPGEEEVVAEAARLLREARPEALTIVVPRHPERGPALAALLGGAPRRAAGQDPRGDHPFWIGDTLGELGLYYRLAPLAFIGNSLPPAQPGGGHNLLEAARLGCALATGPRAFNFDATRQRLAADGALALVSDAASLAGWALRMLDAPEQRVQASAAADRVAREAADLAPATARRLLALLDEQAPGPTPGSVPGPGPG